MNDSNGCQNFIIASGRGGDSSIGFGGKGVIPNAVGTVGTSGGGGAGGAAAANQASRAGGAGGAGIVIIEW